MSENIESTSQVETLPTSATHRTDAALAAHDKFIRSLPERYGEESQFSMAIEEMAELIQALEKHRRSKDDPVKLAAAKEHIAEEIADVRIMLYQLTAIFDNDADVVRYIEYKMQRQQERIESQLPAAWGSAPEAGACEGCENDMASLN